MWLIRFLLQLVVLGVVMGAAYYTYLFSKAIGWQWTVLIIFFITMAGFGIITVMAMREEGVI